MKSPMFLPECMHSCSFTFPPLRVARLSAQPATAATAASARQQMRRPAARPTAPAAARRCRLGRRHGGPDRLRPLDEAVATAQAGKVR